MQAKGGFVTQKLVRGHAAGSGFCQVQEDGMQLNQWPFSFLW